MSKLHILMQLVSFKKDINRKFLAILCTPKKGGDIFVKKFEIFALF